METGENLIGKILDISEISRFAKFVKVMKIRDSFFAKDVKSYHVRKCTAKGKEFVDENGFTCKYIDEAIAKGTVTVYESTYSETTANRLIAANATIGGTYLIPRYYNSKKIILHPYEILSIEGNNVKIKSVIDQKIDKVFGTTEIKTTVSRWFEIELKKATDEYNAAKDRLISIRNKCAKNGISLPSSIN